MCSVWLLVAVVAVGGARGDVSQCWEDPSCQELSSESKMMVRQELDQALDFPKQGQMDCIQLCRSDLSAETPIMPRSTHLQPPPSSDSSSSSSSSPPVKRSYSMEHFRWGKPVGRKRRPVKVYTSNGIEEESAEVLPEDMKRRDLVSELLAAEEEEQKMQDMMKEEERLLEKKDGSYKMKHFRWSGPPASKRYGGFMKSWKERSQRPLLTLFKTVINKDAQKRK